jgi:undecaprenyl-diphosphatase
VVELDRRLDRWVVGHRYDWLDPIFVGASWIGSYGLVWMAIAAVYWWVTRKPYLLMAVAGCIALAEILNYGLKLLIDRERPPASFAEPETLVHTPGTPSFPSGHSVTAFLGATLISFSRARWAIWLYLLAALIAWSRVYVGVHYPLDVLAGAALGTALGYGFKGLRKLAEGRLRLPPAQRPG